MTPPPRQLMRKGGAYRPQYNCESGSKASFVQEPLRVAARLLHKEAAIIRGTRLCFAFYLQITYFFKWSRGDSNP